MAIEDSITLAECLARCTSTSDIPFRLTQYEKLRRERVQIIKEGARKNAAVWHMADGPAQEARDRTFDQFDPSGQNAGEMAQENANSWSDKNFQPWLFGFDASAEVCAIFSWPTLLRANRDYRLPSSSIFKMGLV